MDAFENLIAEILWMDGYWVRTSFKVELTKEDKLKINRPSSPRWELDVVAYSGRRNVLKVIECKSYLDSRGVSVAALNGANPKLGDRYKLFCDDGLREVVFDRLRTQMVERGTCPIDVSVELALACGRIATKKDRDGLKEYFATKNWELLEEDWLRERLQRMAGMGYENQISAVVAKLLLRNKPLQDARTDQ